MILKRIAEIAVAVNKIVGFFTGNLTLSEAVEMIVRMREFIMEVMSSVFRIAE